ncbi:hypothetical protein HK100_005624 [Physocladia obscura]|uniref:Crinkler effector protein N-terminal domain-containing protein n=1 Tax=Physocladia obscura TaxID=109957 RepID=A0AAD5T8E8_9FUNG|nr:hypothetical protein HK100_005624 [Physocladia obscura]
MVKGKRKRSSTSKTRTATATIFCVLANDPNSTGFSVRINTESTTVDNLKKAIRTEKPNVLKGLDADQLTLVRIGKADVGGLNVDELERSPEALDLATYGKRPETITADTAAFQSALGSCLTSENLFSKVTNSAKKLSFFVDSLPQDLYHVLLSVDNFADQEVFQNCEKILRTVPYTVLTQCRENFLKFESCEFKYNGKSIVLFNSNPSLLLTDISNSIDIAKTAYVQDILKVSTTAVVLGSSGSGKTRTILEILATTAGFYFSTRQEAPVKLGSTDMQEMFKKLSEKLIPQDYKENEKYATRYYYCLLAARFFMASHIWPEFKNINAHNWLLIQLDPEGFCNGDVFDKLALQFRHMDPNNLQSYLKTQLNRWTNAT